MAAKASNIVFSESIEIEDIDKEGKKFDRVSRLYAKGRNLGVDITLDYNFELYPLKVGQELTLALASSLSTTGGPATGDAEEEEKERPVWRPDGKGRGGLEKEYDYVMYGKVYKFDSGEKSIVTAYASFGGLLLSITGHFRHMTSIVLGDPVYLLMRK